ncbi:AMP-binding protein, partial [Roseibium sp. RKSG952]|uniref:AMP-binding protein n=1 Tax=Roseibium sp. RKSG952 TaxID=2529384 RepID=UPI0034CE7E10
MLHGFNDTAADYPTDKTVIDLFTDQVQMRPDAPAMIDGDQILSYGELDKTSNRLAGYLIARGVGPECVVGVYLERSAELIIALLAIWKAGGVYLPLDPNYPQERLAFMLEDAGAGLVLTSQKLGERLLSPSDRAGHQTFVLDGTATSVEMTQFSEIEVKDPEQSTSTFAQSLAYVIYTSGSTGQPKGVGVSQDNLYKFLCWVMTSAATPEALEMVLTTSSGFDSSIREMLLPLIGGGVLWCARTSVLLMEPGQLEKLPINALNTTPLVLDQLFGVMPEAWLNKLHFVYCGGAALPISLRERVAQKLDGADLVFGYGPTEATCNVTSMIFDAFAPQGYHNIGKPIPNTQAYIVNSHIAPVPLGVAGELLIGGVQVSR